MISRRINLSRGINADPSIAHVYLVFITGFLANNEHLSRV